MDRSQERRGSADLKTTDKSAPGTTPLLHSGEGRRSLTKLTSLPEIILEQRLAETLALMKRRRGKLKLGTIGVSVEGLMKRLGRLLVIRGWVRGADEWLVFSRACSRESIEWKEAIRAYPV